MAAAASNHVAPAPGGESVKQVLEYLQSFTTIGLILAGLAGLSYHIFRDGGWIEKGLGKIWDFGFEYPLMAIPVIVGAVIFGNLWRQDRLTKGRKSKLPDLIVYGLMGFGAYFIGHYLVTGTL